MARKKPKSQPQAALYPLQSSGREGRSLRGKAADGNGMQCFSFHADDGAVEIASLLRARVPAADAGDLASVDAETAARRYLEGGLASSDLPAFSADDVNGERPQFLGLGTEKVPLTGTQYVKFRQAYERVPVYGSLVSVELDEANRLVSINSSMGSPNNVDPVASVSPAQAVAKVRQLAGYGSQPLDAVPRLNFYFDRSQTRWRLVYILEDVVKSPTGAPEHSHAADPAHGHQHDPLPEVVDYIIDAHNLELVTEVNRVATAAVSETSKDALNVTRTFTAETVAASPLQTHLVNVGLGVETYDFGFRSIRFQASQLPGSVVVKPATAWNADAVSAHANAETVASFLKNELSRDGVDNAGGRLRSSINCVESPFTNNVWRNAAWYLGQMVYGQQKVGTRLRTFAVGLDVVAHEIVHGVTDKTARLEYQSMSGALNESYSDIFGAIVSNYAEDDLSKWNWEMGEDLSSTGNPLRDLRRPGRFGQPEHMDDFLTVDPPFDRTNDYGHVHTNSGIHNLAGHRVIVSKDSGGAFLFNKRTVASLFYVALTQHLSRTSTFSDSRRALELVAATLFRADASAVRQEKIAAIGRAFDTVGIAAA